MCKCDWTYCATREHGSSNPLDLDHQFFFDIEDRE